jgi:hypothetical protein
LSATEYDAIQPKLPHTPRVVVTFALPYFLSKLHLRRLVVLTLVDSRVVVEQQLFRMFNKTRLLLFYFDKLEALPLIALFILLQASSLSLFTVIRFERRKLATQFMHAQLKIWEVSFKSNFPAQRIQHFDY